MIHVIYDKNCTVAYNDVQILSVAEKIVLEHGNTDEVHNVLVGQDMFVTSLRSFMKQNEVPYTNMIVDVVLDSIENCQRLTLTDTYRLSDYTNIPDLVSDILMPLL